MKNLILVLFFAATAFANTHGMTFAGRGEWTDQMGDKTPYQILVHKHFNDDGTKTIMTTIDAGEKHMEWSMTLVPTRVENRYTVNNENGENIGWAYCYLMPGSKVCHMELTPHEGVHIEKTMHMTRGRVNSVGSMASNEETITWVDELRYVHANNSSETDVSDLFK